MDTTKNQKPLSLEQVLVSYNQLIFIFFLFIILMVILLATNQKGFNKSFGYQIFITGPILIIITFLIKEIFAFKNNPQTSWLSTIAQHSESWFIPAMIFITIAIALLGFFMMLYIGGIFSDSIPENNTAMIINFVIIIIFIIITTLIYKQGSNKDAYILNTLPKALQETYHARTKYTVIFAIFCLFITVLYFVNPGGFMTNYKGPVIFFTLFVGIIMLIMISIYQYFLANPSKANLLNDTPGPIAFIIKAFYILASLGISFGLIYGAFILMGVFEQDASNPESWGHLIFNLLLFCGMLAIIYKLANAGGFLDKNPFYRLILNTLLYIPCLLVVILNSITQLFGFAKNPTGTFNFTPPKPVEIKMLLLSTILLATYFLWIFFLKKYTQTKYLKQGGKQLVNQPIPTDTLTNITTYQSLSGTDTFDYQYAISFWLYLDAFPPSTTSSYTKIVPILSYGENPTIKYSSTNNTLYITVKQKTDTNSIVDFIQETNNQNDPIQWNATQSKITDAIENVKSMPFSNEIDADGHRIIYKHPDVKLQKWNHILLNYSGGTLDVFYNGQLVKSAIEVVPYMKFDMLTAGTQDGVSGNIANLMYFKQPLDILTINTLYMSLKDKNPPVISTNNETLISL